VLLVHVVAATGASALINSNLFALVLVKDFFRKYTRIDPHRIDEHAGKFERLEVDSRLEIAFEGKPRGFQTPSYKVFTNEHPHGTVVSDVETRTVQRYITPGCTYKDLEIERTDFLSTYAGEQVEDRESWATNFSDPAPGPSQIVKDREQGRYSHFPREGGYMVPTNNKPVRAKTTVSPEYVNLGKGRLTK
jgi:hypothetical protein